MAITEEFTFHQPLGGSDPANTATGPGELTAATPALTPIMLNETSGKLVVWDGETAGTSVGVLAVSADATTSSLTYYKSGTFRLEDILWPEAVTDESKKRNAFVGTGISIV